MLSFHKKAQFPPEHTALLYCIGDDRVKEFITQNFQWIFVALVIGFFVFQAVSLLRKAKKIDANGTETDAVVSRVVESWDPDTASSSYISYVEYRDETGELRESPMSLLNSVEYGTGEKVRIVYPRRAQTGTPCQEE